MKTFEMLEGYDTEYEMMLRNEMDRLIEKKRTGINFKEDNMIFQLKTHLGIKVELLSQGQGPERPTADKDIGIENYN